MPTYGRNNHQKALGVEASFRVGYGVSFPSPPQSGTYYTCEAENLQAGARERKLAEIPNAGTDCGRTLYPHGEPRLVCFVQSISAEEVVISNRDACRSACMTGEASILGIWSERE